MTNHIPLITQALEAVICSPEHNAKTIESFFAPNYQQKVNGIELDYPLFVAHMAQLKQLGKTMELHILAIAQQGNKVLTHHIVGVSKKSGGHAITEVFACFTVDNGRISGCQELTRLIEGQEEDKHLGSVH
ncbi:nuclear transport factor 2 family protein [Mangrovibacter yixingensis]|uniref:nuclear transport factor 2 family protein n=1 Tax=Mangrovibacter yixingensis TaxID=1529639 RepID=UPI001CFE20BB|nr:nuclear transport factor 2 family protein [Mangrovibacter yixingensis]